MITCQKSGRSPGLFPQVLVQKSTDQRVQVLEASGSKDYILNGCWNQEPKIVRTWTFWAGSRPSYCLRILPVLFGMEVRSSHDQELYDQGLRANEREALTKEA